MGKRRKQYYQRDDSNCSRREKEFQKENNNEFRLNAAEEADESNGIYEK